MSLPRLFDCFPFFNELDLLELRLRELNDVVDFFVICEARKTFTGNDKPLYFSDNMSRFSEFLPKIIHVVVENFADCKSSWDREEYQREQLRRGIGAGRPGDLIMLSDVDEIPKALIVDEIKRKSLNVSDVWCLELDWHAFYLNVRLKEKWGRIGPRIVRIESLNTFWGLRGVYAPTQNKMRDLVRWIKACKRMRRLVHRHVARDAGWHFTWLGGVKSVAEKGSAHSAHSDLPEGKKNEFWARQRINDFLGVDNAFDIVAIDEKFPNFIRENPENFMKYEMRSD